jgi:hypothetical protein
MTVDHGGPASDGNGIETNPAPFEAEAGLPARNVEAIHSSLDQLEVGTAFEAVLASRGLEPAGQRSIDDVGKAED